MTAPKRHWYRFSLRTLFVLVTVVAGGVGGWLKGQREIVDQRRDAIKQISSMRSTHSVDNTFVLFGCVDSLWMAEVRRDVPWAWRLLGAQAVFVISLDSDDYSQVDVDRLSKLFPESCIELNSSDTNIMSVIPPRWQ